MSNVYIVYIIYLLIYLSIYLTIYLLARSAGWRPRAGLRAVRPAAADRQMQLQHSLLHLGYRGEYSTVQYSTVQYSTAQYSTVQYSTVQYSTVYSIVQCIVPAAGVHGDAGRLVHHHPVLVLMDYLHLLVGDRQLVPVYSSV